MTTKVLTTFGELLDKGVWDKYCDAYGLNVWCINEGQADRNEKCEITIDCAKEWGIV